MAHTDNTDCRWLDTAGSFVGLSRSAHERGFHRESLNRLLVISRQTNTAKHIEIITSQLRLYNFTVYMAIIVLILLVSFVCSKLKSVCSWIKDRRRRTDGRYEYE